MLVADPLFDTVLRSLILAAIALSWVTVLIRITGLRSLSKMTNFDFVMTIALGSLVATGAMVTKWLDFLQALIAMAALFLVQFAASRLRKSSEMVETAIQNEPILLMKDGEFRRDAMDTTRVTESDIIAKLREANVLDFSEVRAVVLETTGDVSVLHGDALDDALLEGVRNTD